MVKNLIIHSGKRQDSGHQILWLIIFGFISFAIFIELFENVAEYICIYITYSIMEWWLRTNDNSQYRLIHFKEAHFWALCPLSWREKKGGLVCLQINNCTLIWHVIGGKTLRLTNELLVKCIIANLEAHKSSLFLFSQDRAVCQEVCLFNMDQSL